MIRKSCARLHLCVGQRRDVSARRPASVDRSPQTDYISLCSLALGNKKVMSCLKYIDTFNSSLMLCIQGPTPGQYRAGASRLVRSRLSISLAVAREFCYKDIYHNDAGLLPFCLVYARLMWPLDHLLGRPACT
jgi:hypothetical protein